MSNVTDPAFGHASSLGQTNGLSKRELIAAMAMQGMLSDGERVVRASIIAFSVQYADALLAELEKGPTE